MRYNKESIDEKGGKFSTEYRNLRIEQRLRDSPEDIFQVYIVNLGVKITRRKEVQVKIQIKRTDEPGVWISLRLWPSCYSGDEKK